MLKSRIRLVLEHSFPETRNCKLFLSMCQTAITSGFNIKAFELTKFMFTSKVPFEDLNLDQIPAVDNEIELQIIALLQPVNKYVKFLVRVINPGSDRESISVIQKT